MEQGGKDEEIVFLHPNPVLLPSNLTQFEMVAEN